MKKFNMIVEGNNILENAKGTQDEINKLYIILLKKRENAGSQILVNSTSMMWIENKCLQGEAFWPTGKQCPEGQVQASY